MIKLNKLLPTILPKEALKFPIRTKLMEALNSGNEVATPRKIAPATVAPNCNSFAILSVTWVNKILTTTKATLKMIKRKAICFTVNEIYTSSTLSPLSSCFMNFTFTR